MTKIKSGCLEDVKVQTSDTAEPKVWNENLRKSVYGTVYQTTHYANYAREELKWKPFYITAERGNEMGQLLLFVAPRIDRFLHRTRAPRAIYDVLTLVRPKVRWIYGPVVMGGDDMYSATLENAVKIVKRRSGVVTRAVPHPLDDRKLQYDKFNFIPRNEGTFIVDLRKDLKELWSGLDKKSARKNVERATRRGVHVRIAKDEDDLLGYYYALRETHLRDHVEPPTFRDMKRLWENLKENGCMEFFVASWRKKVVAGLAVSTFNGYLNEWGAATSNEVAKERLYASELLRWKIIEWGHEKGFRCYDLSGVDPYAKDEKARGILRFKEKWGGKMVLYNRYQL